MAQTKPLEIELLSPSRNITFATAIYTIALNEKI